LAELAVLTALAAYGESAVALFGELRRPGAFGRVAIWGVRIGWIAQTGVLVVQADRAHGFPWATWGGALNLFAWLVVSVYLIWGCRPRFRLVGLGVMPVAAALLALAYLGGGTRTGSGDGTTAVLAAHVALILAAFSGFTLAAGLSALFVWHERRLKRRIPSVLLARVPPLEALDRLATRSLAVSVAALAAGVALGIVSLGPNGADAVMLVTAVAGAGWTALLVARAWRLIPARSAAYLTVAAFGLVLVVLPLTHFAT
jgi:ABC-type uncharacterized transport system permease subunit